ncbi:uncharacterized protein [Antennarius striatus]|uniref:uncharacterized protein n=1 Tax=Antennarius striatus TaxID=241820 RepID=UPI0035AF6108
MDPEDCVVTGAVLIIHNIHDEKHQYGVKNVAEHKKARGTKSFTSGDKLVAINGLDMQKITPEVLAEMLAEGNPKLTVHKANWKEEHIEPSSPAEDTLLPVSKESTLLCFSMEMRREIDLEKNEDEIDLVKNEAEEEGEEKGDTIIEDDVCKEDVLDLLIISMRKVSISLVSGRGCDDAGTCEECHGTKCSVNDVVVVSESSTLMIGSGSLKLEKTSDYAVKQVESDLYLRGVCSKQFLYASPNPEKITMYIYKSTTDNFRGLPVVLNLSKTNCFLRCCKQKEKVFLQVQTCEKQRLQQISKSDESTLAFVFYMKSDPSKKRMFESAVNPGWFIHVVNTDSVDMACLNEETEESLLFIIQK